MDVDIVVVLLVLLDGGMDDDPSASSVGKGGTRPSRADWTDKDGAPDLLPPFKGNWTSEAKSPVPAAAITLAAVRLDPSSPVKLASRGVVAGALASQAAPHLFSNGTASVSVSDRWTCWMIP